MQDAAIVTRARQRPCRRACTAQHVRRVYIYMCVCVCVCLSTWLSWGLPRNIVLLMEEILHQFWWKGTYPRAPILILGRALSSPGWEVPMAKILHHPACCPTLNQGARGVKATVAVRPTRFEAVQDFFHQPFNILFYEYGLLGDANRSRGLHGIVEITKAYQAWFAPQAFAAPWGRASRCRILRGL